MWPGDGELTFVAVTNAPESDFVPNYTAGSDSEPMLESFTYTVPADATAQNDIVMAKSTCVGNLDASAPLKFEHIMSAVNVKIGSVVPGEIRSITFKNVYNKGNYLVDQGVWVVDKNSVGDFTVKMEGDKFVSTGNESGQMVNTEDATFMMIPQNPGENAEMVIEFYDNDTQTLYSGSTALRGSIAGDNWDKAKTTNYMLSIDESFTLTIEPVGKKLDAHYIIGYANVKVVGIPNWEISISADGVANSDISLLPEDLVNPNAKQGFWTDKIVDANGNITNESARGTNKYPGSGDINKMFYLFIPENIGDGDREIRLTLKSTSSTSTASTTKILLQKNPNWTAEGFGWEVVDDDETGTFGFKWTRKIAYIYPYSRLLASTARNHCQDFIDDYGAGTNNFATVGMISLGIGKNRAYILLDYTKLNNLTGADSPTEGFNNTLALYRQAGTTATSQFETIVTTTMKTERGHETEPMFRYPTDDEISRGCPAESGKANDLSAIMEYVQKKNRYNLQKRTVSGDATGNAYVPYFVESDLKWYLPAHGQFQYFTPDPNIPGDDKANYWSSTAVNGATDSYIGDGTPKDRDLEYRVIAVRMDEYGYGNVTVSEISTEEMKGGENGEAQWVE